MTRQSIGTLLVFLPLALIAQSPRESTVVPLNNWVVPGRVARTQAHDPRKKLQLPGGVTSEVLVFVPMAPCRLADTRPGSGYPALGSTPLASVRN